MSQRYYFPPLGGGVDAIDTQGKNTLVYLPFPVGQTTTFDRIGIYVGTGRADTNLRVGLYNTVAGAPSALLEDSGSLNGTTSATLQVTTISRTLEPGLYWIAVVWQGSGGTMPSVTSMSVNVLRPNMWSGTPAGYVANASNLHRYYVDNDVSITGALPATAVMSPGGGNGSPIRSGMMRAQ